MLSDTPIIHIYIYITSPPRPTPPITASSHNFKSQNFKLSVSNPESKYAAYLSVL